MPYISKIKLNIKNNNKNKEINQLIATSSWKY